MYRLLLITIMIAFFGSCKEARVSLSGNEPVSFEKFSSVIPALKLPSRISDTNILKLSDTTVISKAVLAGIVSDSSITDVFGKKTDKGIFRPVGKIEKQDEWYLLVTYTAEKRSSLGVFLLDKEHHPKAAMKLLDQKVKDGYIHNVNITSEPTFIIAREKNDNEGNLLYTRNGYAYNNAIDSFTVLMNDTNEDLKKINQIINPIDTLPAHNKYSGDYEIDKRNFVSVRDGGASKRYIFFLHFEKNNGDCKGELKGSIEMTDEDHGLYTQNGDPCVMDFNFSTSSVKVKEQGNCGNHRDIQCFFDDTYKKKKPAKKSKKSSKD